MLLVVLACATPEAPPPVARVAGSAEQPDIVILVASGLRADTSEPGAEAVFYEALGHEPSTRFSAAYAQSCTPHTSFGSMLTGRYPSSIPLCAMVSGSSLTPAAQQPWCSTLPPGTTGMAEVAKAYGYSTGAYVADVTKGYSSDWEVLEETAAAWWSEHSGPRLYLVMVSDLHMLQYRPSVALRPEPDKAERERIDLAAVAEDYRRVTRSVGEGLSRVLDVLPSDDRWVFVTSTNGLSLGERTGVKSDHLGAVTHGIIVDRTVRVPLAILEPAPGRGEVDDVVELIDLVPTIAELVGGVAPAGLTGRSLLASGPDPAPYAYAEFGDMLSLREGSDFLALRWFLHNASSLDLRLTDGLLEATIGSDAFTLHDVERDPLQEEDLVMEQPERAEELRALMVEVRTGPGAPPETDRSRIEPLQLQSADGYW